MHAAAQNWKKPAVCSCQYGASGAHDPGCPAVDIVEVPQKHVVEGGSTRSERAPAYHLNPGHGYRRTSVRFGLGAELHGEGNWKKSIVAGMKEARAFCNEAFNHMMEHMRKMRLGQDPEDDHLGAIGWGVEVLAFAEEHWGAPWTELGQ